MTKLTVIIPSRNEQDNVAILVRQLNGALSGVDAEILYVDDSTDNTVSRVEEAAQWSTLPLRVYHRDHPAGGLSGAVVEGFSRANGDYVVVMDGDLQHPPSTISEIRHRLESGAELVIASRYLDGGGADGLASRRRRLVSSGATFTSKTLMPQALRGCTDPMTGFFGVRKSALNVERLSPTGFKILLEILATHDLNIAEVPFVFRQRESGNSKASLMQGLLFVRQLLELRRRRNEEEAFHRSENRRVRPRVRV